MELGFPLWLLTAKLLGSQGLIFPSVKILLTYATLSAIRLGPQPSLLSCLGSHLGDFSTALNIIYMLY